MIEAETYETISGLISADDFYYPNNGKLFNVIKDLATKGECYDLSMVAGILRQKCPEISIDYVVSLTNIIPNASNIERYAIAVKKTSIARQTLNKLREAAELLYNPYTQIEDAIDYIDSNIFQLIELNKKDAPVPLSELIHKMLDDLDKVKNTDISTHFTDLDRLINGFQAGDLIIIAGRPSMGKTSFMLDIARNVASSGYCVGINSLEMSKDQLTKRIASAMTDINYQKLAKSTLAQHEWATLINQSGVMSKLPIFIDDTGALNITTIRSKARRLKRKHDLKLLIVDYLQLVQSRNAETREQQISDISRSLKALAKELQIPVIALSQLNRAVEARADKRPLLSDLRESGAIEQDADLIMFLYRDEYYYKDSKQKGLAEVIVSKHRNGPVGTVTLKFQNHIAKFENNL
jgi:replicative DNA helicase